MRTLEESSHLDMAESLSKWSRFLDELTDEGPMRSVILKSWRQSEAAGVERAAEQIEFHRVSDEELQRRLSENADWLAIARPHLEWLTATLAHVRHVVYLTDRDGIVLHSVGDQDFVEAFRLSPGYDWSEGRMGTNGAGSALAANRPVAVVGPDHFISSFHDCTCTGAPIHAPDGTLIGAIDISTRVADGSPERLAIAAHAAYAIGRELNYERQEENLRNAEQSLRESEVRLRTILDNTSAVGDDAREPPSTMRGRRILVVDDKMAAAQMFAALLSKLGDHEVQTAHDGPSALELVGRLRPEIVLLDIGLPGMDGYQVAREIRQDRRLDDLLLVALTGYGQEEDRRKANEAGFDEHLVKPPSLDQVKAILVHPKLQGAGRREDVAADPQAPRPPGSSASPPHNESFELGGSSVSPTADLRHIRHHLGNTAFALKMAVQALAQSGQKPELLNNMTGLLSREVANLEQLVQTLQHAIEERED